MVDGEEVPHGIAYQVIERCYRVYKVRDLAPSSKFLKRYAPKDEDEKEKPQRTVVTQAGDNDSEKGPTTETEDLMSNHSQDRHNRLFVLRSRLKALCRTHGVQPVADYFVNAKDGNLLELECGCRRQEKLEQA